MGGRTKSADENDHCSVFEEGPEIHPPFQTPVGKVGLQICFDLRYPEPALSMKRQNAHIITYPSAFTVPTGKAHWELLLRARAVETQSYGKRFLKHSFPSLFSHLFLVDTV